MWGRKESDPPARRRGISAPPVGIRCGTVWRVLRCPVESVRTVTRRPSDGRLPATVTGKIRDYCVWRDLIFVLWFGGL